MNVYYFDRKLKKKKKLSVQCLFFAKKGLFPGKTPTSQTAVALKLH